MAKVPGLSRYVAEAARARLHELEVGGPGTRGIAETTTAYEARGRRERRDYLMIVGLALLNGESVQAGLDTLALAVAQGWDPRRFLEVGARRLAHGDLQGARRMFEYVQADPIDGTVLRDSIPVAFRLTDSQGSVLRGAHDVMRERIRHDLTDRFLGAPVPVRPADGTALDLRDALRGSVTVVVYWAHGTRPEAELTARRLAPARELLEEAGVRIVVLTRPGIEPTPETLAAAASLGLPVYFSADPTVPSVLGVTRFDQLFVIEGGRRVRYQNDSPDIEAVVRSAWALATARRPSPADHP